MTVDASRPLELLYLYRIETSAYLDLDPDPDEHDSGYGSSQGGFGDHLPGPLLSSLLSSLETSLVEELYSGLPLCSDRSDGVRGHQKQAPGDRMPSRVVEVGEDGGGEYWEGVVKDGDGAIKSRASSGFCVSYVDPFPPDFLSTGKVEGQIDPYPRLDFYIALSDEPDFRRPL